MKVTNNTKGKYKMKLLKHEIKKQEEDQVTTLETAVYLIIQPVIKG